MVSPETALAVRAVSRSNDIYPTQEVAEAPLKTPDDLHAWIAEITGHDIVVKMI